MMRDGHEVTLDRDPRTTVLKEPTDALEDEWA